MGSGGGPTRFPVVSEGEVTEYDLTGFGFRWPTNVIQLRNTDLTDWSSYLTPLHLLFESPE